MPNRSTKCLHELCQLLLPSAGCRTIARWLAAAAAVAAQALALATNAVLLFPSFPLSLPTSGACRAVACVVALFLLAAGLVCVCAGTLFGCDPQRFIRAASESAGHTPPTQWVPSRAKGSNTPASSPSTRSDVRRCPTSNYPPLCLLPSLLSGNHRPTNTNALLEIKPISPATFYLWNPPEKMADESQSQGRDTHASSA